ncbi:MAG: hypothetical protein J0L56_00330 [Chitinophagales bacterium]|nr:hypothetical protein [Chitinophagales bacterium]
MKGSITPKELEKLVRNQQQFQHDPPVTTRATFKLRDLEELIAEIRKAIGDYIPDEDHNHQVCITFVRDEIREEVQESALKYKSKWLGHRNLKINTVTNGSENFTQLIPVITGCKAKLDVHYNYDSFEYLRNEDRVISFVRPGGEATGLIPPPPPSENDDDFS